MSSRHVLVGSIVTLSSALLALPSRALAQTSDAAALPEPVLTLIMVGALSLLPLLFMATTSYVKISVVFSLLRNALGAGQVPGATVVAALAAILSLYVMAPVGARIAEEAEPFAAAIDPSHPLDDLDALTALFEAGSRPLRAFLDRHSGEREQGLFLELARQARPEAERDELSAEDLLVLLPSFLVTELTEAFQIGFLVFLPFLVLDLVVANILMSLGMHSVDPGRIAMPLKLLLFVLVDGWYLLSRALVLGYVA